MNDNLATSHAGEPLAMANAGTHEAVFDLIKQLLPAPAHVLDVAAGEGAFSVKLQEVGYDVQALDFNRDNWKADSIPLLVANLDTDFASEFPESKGRFDALVA